MTKQKHMFMFNKILISEMIKCMLCNQIYLKKLFAVIVVADADDEGHVCLNLNFRQIFP